MSHVQVYLLYHSQKLLTYISQPGSIWKFIILIIRYIVIDVGMLSGKLQNLKYLQSLEMRRSSYLHIVTADVLNNKYKTLVPLFLQLKPVR